MSAAYNFTQSGVGDYSIEPSNLFTYVDTDGALKNLYATVEDVAKVRLSGILAISRRNEDDPPEGELPTVPNFYDCTIEQEVILSAAYLLAEKYVLVAFKYIQARTTITVRWYHWFGLNIPRRREVALNIFKMISTQAVTDLTLVCTVRFPAKAAWVSTCIFQP